MKKTGKKAITLAGLLLTGIIGIRSTMAYFTENAVKTNVFTLGDLDIGLEEPEWDPDPEDGTPDGENLYPGCTVYKNPTIKNLTSDKNGEEPCYARIKVSILDSKEKLISSRAALDLIRKTIYFDKTYNGSYDKKGTATGLVEGRVPGYSLAELAQYPTVNPDFVLDETRSTDSVLVYNYMGENGTGLLNTGKEATLFTTIVIPTDWNQTQFSVMGDFHLNIEAECIQSSGFADQADAFAALDREVAQGTLQQIER